MFHEEFLVEIFRSIQVIWKLPPNFILLYVTSLGNLLTILLLILLPLAPNCNDFMLLGVTMGPMSK